MKNLMLVAMIAALAAPAWANGTTPQPGRVTVTFEPASATGSMLVSLFDSESAYAGGKPIRQARIDLARGERSAIFTDLVQGKYAVKAFQDIDGDGRMTTNPFGRPVEPFAFSNNAIGNMGPAGWDRAHFAVQGETTQTIQIR
jgi:uncharacterized protein (DUF2141 family)